MLQHLRDILLELGEFPNLIGADLIEGVQELIHFSILLIQDLIFFLVFLLSLLVLQDGIEIPEFFLIDVNILFDFLAPLLHVADGVIILFHSGQNSFSGFGNAQVGFVELDLIVSLFDLQLSDLVFKQLSLKLLAVHSQLVLSVGKLIQKLLHGYLLRVVLVDEFGIFADEPLIL